MIPLLPGREYSLEDISNLSKFILIKMLELLGESAWGVINIAAAIRSQIKKNYDVFYSKYSNLSTEQKQILEFLAKRPGQAVLAREVSKLLKFGRHINPEKEIKSLISTSWIIGGANSNELVLLMTVEIAALINVLPKYLAYLEAEKPLETTADSGGLKVFDDLCQLTSHILTESPKITNNGLISKSFLKKVMPRLSPLASDRWEDYQKNNYYPFLVSILLKTCEYFDCLEEVQTQPSGRLLILKTKNYIDYLKIPTFRKLGAFLLIFLDNLRNLGGFDFLGATEDLLRFGQKAKGRFLAPLRMMQLCSRKAKFETIKYGEFFDTYCTKYIFNPMFYMGFMERTTIKMPAPWHSNTDSDENLTDRYLWRISPLGLIFGDVLKKAGENLRGTKNKKSILRVPNYSTYIPLNIELASNEDSVFSDNMFLDRFEKVFPPFVQKELVIQNDMTFFVPLNAQPELIWLLHVFGETTGADNSNYIVSGRFTKESVIKALKSGLAINSLTTLMKNESKTELSPTVTRVLEDWGSSYNRAIFARVTVIVCDSPELAAELSANVKFSEIILGRLGPQTVFIREEAEKTVRLWLEKKGRVPLPGIYGGEPLAEWVGKYAGNI